MRDFVDVVEGHSKKRMREWLVRAWLYEQEHQIEEYKEYVRPQVRKGKLVVGKSTFKPNERERTLKRMLDHSGSSTYDLWKKVVEFKLNGVYDFIEDEGGKIGPNPGVGIEWVPIDEAVYYGCQDADVTGQAMVWMQEERKKRVGGLGEWSVSELDWDQIESVKRERKRV
jgi:hypothetical protein